MVIAYLLISYVFLPKPGDFDVVVNDVVEDTVGPFWLGYCAICISFKIYLF